MLDCVTISGVTHKARIPLIAIACIINNKGKLGRSTHQRILDTVSTRIIAPATPPEIGLADKSILPPEYVM